MNYWATFAQTIDNVNRSVGNAVAYTSLVMALVTTTVVVLRYGFGQGAIAAQESVLYLHGTLFMLGAAPTLLGMHLLESSLFCLGNSQFNHSMLAYRLESTSTLYLS